MSEIISAGGSPSKRRKSDGEEEVVEDTSHKDKG